MATSSTKGAVIPRLRRPATKVIVFQALWRAYAPPPSPRRTRPRSRTIAVFVQVSSMNTSRAGSNMPCSRIQRRRARATSARFCSAAYRVFFEADVASVAEPPNRAAAARDAALVHRRNDLVQRQVRLLGDEREQEFRVLFQLRSASATWLCGNASGCFEALRPNHHHTGADPIVFGRRTPRCTADNVSDYSGTQVAGIRLGHGIPRHRIKDKRLPHWQAVGNPSDSSRAKFALDRASGASPTCVGEGWGEGLRSLGSMR